MNIWRPSSGSAFCWDGSRTNEFPLKRRIWIEKSWRGSISEKLILSLEAWVWWHRWTHAFVSNLLMKFKPNSYSTWIQDSLTHGVHCGFHLPVTWRPKVNIKSAFLLKPSTCSLLSTNITIGFQTLGLLRNKNIRYQSISN